MRKLLISTILGLTITGGADASIVSRGFFEEQIGNYATLDLLNSKANQKDLTALSNKIGILPDDITVQAMLEGWTDSSGDPFPGLFPISLGERNVIDSYGGHGTARLLINGAKATTIDGLDYTGPVYPLWKLSEGIDKIASIETKIGTLPAGYETVGAALEAINAKVDNKITNLSATASNGKYVLTAVKEGDQTTYAWESIDRSESETTTTE